MADEFSTLLQVDNSLVRKWGRAIIALQDENAPVPETFFTPTGHPIAFPLDAKQLGFITTDGVTDSKAISSEVTQMMQWLEPVRRDLTGIEKSITVAFGEGSNGYVQALRQGLPVSEFPEEPDGAFAFHGGEISAFPNYRLWLWYADGVGENIRYRLEYCYRATVTAVTDRTKSRTAPETIGVTFGLSKDPVANRDVSEFENGPSLVVSP